MKTTRYTEEFKQSMATLHENGKSICQLHKEYGVSSSALSKWCRKYTSIRIDSETVLTGKQIQALQKRNAELEEENLILKKAIAIFTPRSKKE